MRIGFDNLGETRAGAWSVEMQAHAERQGDAFRPVGERMPLTNIDAEVAMIEANLAGRTDRQIGMMDELAAPAAVREALREAA